LCDCVDERTIEKYKKEAVDKNRESWFLAYIMDTSEEEKAKGKTVEVGRAAFETTNRRFTILDAPGHKSYVPNMIAGASQADIGVLIISARKGEFETGFERGGQTREHAMLAKTLGVEKLLITINKMDDPSVEWAQSRYDEIEKKLTPFLKSQGFKPSEFLFLPISGLTGDNVKERKNTPAWYQGKSLLDTLDQLSVEKRKSDAPLRIPMLDGYKDMGSNMAIGKVEQGTARPGQKCIVMPTGHKCTIVAVNINDEEMQYATAGENVTCKMHGVTDEQLSKGFVLCDAPKPVPIVMKFKAKLKITELPEERPVLTSGYKCILHVHVASEECEILKLNDVMYLSDKDKKLEKNPRFVRENSAVTCTILLSRSVALDLFSTTAQLGRFTLRDEGRTIALGKVIELPKTAAEKGETKDKK
jgi:peptide chain release factor subunit 3